MPVYRLALLGFGNVGRALARLLLEKRADLQAQYNLDFVVTGIMTGRHGGALAPRGLDLNRALDLASRGEPLSELSTEPPPVDGLDFVQRVQADVLFESIPVNYESGQPALTYLETALRRGMHAVTANKGPVVHGYQHLRALARQHGVRFLFESAVMDGAPVFALHAYGLPAARVTALYGILNSTTNLILTRMEEEGETFDEALAYAQRIGIAETDPSGDVDGWDAAIKIAALVTVYMGVPMTPQQVLRWGIRDLTPDDIAAARRQGKRWKLVCSARRLDDGRVEARVEPQMVGPESPLYGVRGTSAILQIETDTLGTLSLREDDPTPRTTAYGLLADWLRAIGVAP